MYVRGAPTIVRGRKLSRRAGNKKKKLTAAVRAFAVYIHYYIMYNYILASLIIIARGKGTTVRIRRGI